MINKKKLLLFTLIVINSKAQQNQNSSYYFEGLPKSPSAKLFMKYGDDNNSEYTGANSPLIPLFNVEEGDIKVPLILKYISGNGIKVRDEASNVGLGWGMPLANISQEVLGGYDDLFFDRKVKLNFLYDSTPPVIRNWFAVCENTVVPSQYMTEPNEDKLTFFKINWNLLPVDGSFKNYNTSITDYDTSPDIFTCNLFGEKLIFVTSNFQTINPTQTFNPTFECLNKKGYKISFNPTDFFIITDTRGIKYYFGKTETYSSSGTGTVSGSNASNRNYVITKIVDKNNRNVNFTYDEVTNVSTIPFYAQSLNFTQSYDSYNTSFNSFPPNSIDPSTCNLYTGSQGDEFKLGDGTQSLAPYGANIPADTFFVPSPYTNGFIYDKLLIIREISGDFGKVNFNYSSRVDYTDNRKLDNVTVTAPLSNVVKNIVFNYSYFNSQNSITLRDQKPLLNIINSYPTSITQDYLSKRLKLDAVIIDGNEQYFFKYNSTPIVDKDSFAVDYWGYYNGGITNKTLFANPNDFNNTGIPLNDKNNNLKTANINYTKAGILEKIIYPTKGYSVFNYELNGGENLFYSNDFSTTINSGNGLRIKEQINYDNNDNISDKTVYEYGGGIAINPLDLFKKYQYKFASGVGGTASINRFNLVLSTLAVSDITASPLSSGNFIGYSMVTKKKLDNINNSTGKVVTTFYNNPDISFQYKDDNIPLYMPNRASKAPENGLIKNVKIYDSSDNLIKETINTYDYKYSKFFYGSSVILSNSARKGNPCVFPGDCTNKILADHPIAVFGYYPIYSKESLLANTQTKEYFNGAEMFTNTDYAYNGYNFLSQKTTLMPTATQISESYSYSSLIPRFSQANILSNNIDKKIYKNGKEIFHESTQFDNISHFNPTSKSIYDLPSGNASTEVTFDKYDTKGNLQQYTSKDGVSTTIIWGYNQTKPIAKIEGAQLTDISTSLIADIVNASDIDNSMPPLTDESLFLLALDNFRKDISLANYQITTYTYDPLIGLRSITPPSGIRENYKYDSSNRLEKIIDVNNTLLKEFKYNYTPMVFKNSTQSQPFVRNNCGSGAIGGTYTYTVPAGQYTSTISVGDAEQQALNDITINGQNAANIYGTCIPLNCSVSFNSSIGISGGGSVSVQTNSYYKVSFGFSSGANSTNLPWSTGVKVATIIGSCKPMVEYSSYNGQVYYTITTSGDIIIRTHSGATLSNNTSYGYDLIFPMN